MPPSPPPFHWSWLGRIPYGEALERQRTWRRGVIDHRQESTLWLLEHDSVVTVGRRPAPGTPDAEEFAEMGIDFFHTERGGLATYHGPGQLVGYLICDIGAYGLGVRQTVERMEQGLIDWLRAAGVPAERREGAPGAWVASDKVAALGLHFKRGVSMHGFALNLTTDLAPYSMFVPCGLTDAGVTSLEKLRPGACPSPRQAASSVAQAVLTALGIEAQQRVTPLPPVETTGDA